MAKQGEIDYLNNLGPDGQEHALKKPFSDPNCGQYLVDWGTVIGLLPQPPARVLDMGCGTGWTSVFLARRGYTVVGQDIAPDMVRLAEFNKERDDLGNLSFVVSDYEEMEFRNEFDVAIFYDSLHHSVNERLAMGSAYNSLKPGGILITVEPGVGHANSVHSKNAMKKFGVTEKDMPPRLVVAVGKELGFRQAKVYRRFLSPVELQPAYSLKGVRRRIKCVLSLHFRMFYMRQSNFVILTK